LVETQPEIKFKTYNLSKWNRETKPKPPHVNLPRLHQVQNRKSKHQNQNTKSKHKFKTPTLPRTREDWGTQKAWKREPKPKSTYAHAGRTRAGRS
jgi:hypothetical protein